MASISPSIVTGLLRQKMDFNGLIVTDALQMNGLMKLFPEGGAAASARGAVEALKAGNDMLLLPADLDAAYNGVLNAVRSGEIPESRIDQSVLKILRAKASVGLNKARLVDINAVNQVIAKPENLRTAQIIADSSVTLVRDNKQVLPLQRTRGNQSTRRCVSISRRGARSRSGTHFQRRQSFRLGARVRAAGAAAHPRRRKSCMSMCATANGMTPTVLERGRKG